MCDINKKTAVISAAGGITITLLTGVIISRALLGGTHYGLPIAWIYKLVLAPQYNPWRIDFVGFVVDMIFWTVLIYVALNICKKSCEKKEN